VEASTNGEIDHSIEFDLSCVAALIVTHVYIYHVGRLPYLFAAGFRGAILCSIPSARLLPLVIEDALKIGFTRDRRLIENFLAKVNDQLMLLNYPQWHGRRRAHCQLPQSYDCRSCHCVLFVGYQAQGTPGYNILVRAGAGHNRFGW
jgi:predicted metal-dependent RNase